MKHQICQDLGECCQLCFFHCYFHNPHCYNLSELVDQIDVDNGFEVNQFKNGGFLGARVIECVVGGL